MKRAYQIPNSCVVYATTSTVIMGSTYNDNLEHGGKPGGTTGLNVVGRKVPLVVH